MTTSGCGASADPQDGLAAHPPPAHPLPGQFISSHLISPISRLDTSRLISRDCRHSLALRPLSETRRPRRARDHPLPRLLPQLAHKQVHQSDPTRSHRCHDSRPSTRVPNCRSFSHRTSLNRPSGQETAARRRVQWRARFDRPRPPRTPIPLCSPLVQRLEREPLLAILAL